MEAHPPYAEFPVVNCGVDWLTCTQKLRGVSSTLWDFGLRELDKVKTADGQISAAYRLGFSGRSGGHIFLGQRPGDVMVQLTGSPCTPLAQEAITLATNVSRIDLQVTVWTEGEACNLAKWTNDVLIRRRNGSAAGGEVSLISTYPSGDTLSINRRCSARFFRLYDKTAESDLGPQHLLWRYEVESKGPQAKRVAARLAKYGVHPSHVSKLVHGWYTEKGVRPAWESGSYHLIAGPPLEPPRRDVLTWMRESLSKTITKAIRKHGREVVLDALGLLDHTQTEVSNHVDVLPAIRDALSSGVQLRDSRAVVPERILLHKQGRDVR